jgi:aminoglycoside/choline kinase family phosphotransferase
VATLSIDKLAPIIADRLRAVGYTDDELPLAGEAGSGRQYFRADVGGISFVVMQSSSSDQDFEHFLDYSAFLASAGMSVPAVHCVAREHWQVLLEDLGDYRLYDAYQADPEAAADYYRESVLLLAALQASAMPIVARCPRLATRIFDIDYLRWETQYFFDNYLTSRHTIADAETFETAFAALAEATLAHPQVVIHRDYQSQNLMVKDGCVRMIDYQGARIGSMYYDVASLLWDPYVSLPQEQVRVLFDAFTNVSPTHSPDEAWGQFLEASLQRLMQACGAYCFLSEHKGRTSFAQHLGPGLQQLATVLALADEAGTGFGLPELLLPLLTAD